MFNLYLKIRSYWLVSNVNKNRQCLALGICEKKSKWKIISGGLYHQTSIYSKSTIETWEKGVKYVQS